MNIHEESYYIVYPDYEFDEYKTDLIPTPYTANTNWDFEKLNVESETLSFVSKNDNLNFLMEDYALAFSVPNFIVTSKLKELIESGLYGSQFVPAIIQDKQNNSVKGLWALNTFKTLNCIDLNRSKFYMPGNGSTNIDGFTIHADMDNYRFREDILDAIPEAERLIFQVAGTSLGEIFVHQKVVDIFKEHNVKGINFFKVSEFVDGEQY
ncbi:hypothetical protein I6M54_17195 [Shewanella algae]|uniref:imm11 family protein n=1 Tax=Shewanella algae TaxID=38313 RepID=UPI001AAC5736|nr:DUF1629 domain-containing protein [Shewanella algae]MBO2596544.1 hypothetical protein [Shewanella algae]MBO2667904.1 hypothetical protein [Shewanella algae]